MPDIINTLRNSSVTRNLSDTAIRHISTLFAIQTYPSGALIATSARHTNSHFSILAKGNVLIKVPAGVGESTACMLSPGDLVDFNDPISNAHFYAQGDTNILSMTEAQFSDLVRTDPSMMCHIIDGMVHSLQSILRRTNRQIADLKNYIYSMNVRS